MDVIALHTFSFWCWLIKKGDNYDFNHHKFFANYLYILPAFVINFRFCNSCFAISLYIFSFLRFCCFLLLSYNVSAVKWLERLTVSICGVLGNFDGCLLCVRLSFMLIIWINSMVPSPVPTTSFPSFRSSKFLTPPAYKSPSPIFIFLGSRVIFE